MFLKVLKVSGIFGISGIFWNFLEFPGFSGILLDPVPRQTLHSKVGPGSSEPTTRVYRDQQVFVSLVQVVFVWKAETSPVHTSGLASANPCPGSSKPWLGYLWLGWFLEASSSQHIFMFCIFTLPTTLYNSLKCFLNFRMLQNF